MCAKFIAIVIFYTRRRRRRDGGTWSPPGSLLASRIRNSSGKLGRSIKHRRSVNGDVRGGRRPTPPPVMLVGRSVTALLPLLPVGPFTSAPTDAAGATASTGGGGSQTQASVVDDGRRLLGSSLSRAGVAPPPLPPLSTAPPLSKWTSRTLQFSYLSSDEGQLLSAVGPAVG